MGHQRFSSEGSRLRVEAFRGQSLGIILGLGTWGGHSTTV